MLSFSESDPEFVVSPAPVEKLQAEISDEEYEAKIAGLIERAWKRDVESDSSARDAYREAFTVLNRGDHYLLVMSSTAIDVCSSIQRRDSGSTTTMTTTTATVTNR